jgi:hypothetical protein
VYAEPTWPTQKGTFTATSDENIPAFPKKMTGYISVAGRDFWGNSFESKGKLRIFQGDDWMGIPDFPNTQNSCSTGVFMIRWRSANQDVRVLTSARYSSAETFYENSATGMYGYISGNNCEQPMFMFGGAANGNASTLVDVSYELKFWKAAK